MKLDLQMYREKTNISHVLGHPTLFTKVGLTSNIYGDKKDIVIILFENSLNLCSWGNSQMDNNPVSSIQIPSGIGPNQAANAWNTQYLTWPNSEYIENTGSLTQRFNPLTQTCCEIHLSKISHEGSLLNENRLHIRPASKDITWGEEWLISNSIQLNSASHLFGLV